MQGAKLGQGGNDQVVRDEIDAGQSQNAGEFARQGLSQAHDPVGLDRHAFGLGKEARSRPGQAAPHRAAFDELHPERDLQRLKPAHHRGLVDLQFRGRGCGAAVTRHREEGAQIVPVEHGANTLQQCRTVQRSSAL